ncbi:MAG: glycosyltransferase family 9 protein [Candidatus Omnitrophica bacterium]|nr:glycosyltransferase family 9 protein [Candidatus Omnitrophota bacterium]MBU1925322.1 glycosyltransferase family 9 protein [Candidatus Omnitrophota bacterium]
MKKILVINPFGVGDVVFTFPLIRALKKTYPDSSIRYLCNSQVEPILKNNHDINELLFYSRGDLKKIKQKSLLSYIRKIVEAVWNLKKINFDLAVDLSLVSQYSFILWLVGVKKRYGFDSRGRGFFLTDKIVLSGFKNKHVVEYYRDLLAKVGINSFEKSAELAVADEDKTFADDFFKNHGLTEQDIVIGLAAFGGESWGTNAKNKHWPLEKYARLSQKIIDRFGAKIILFGTQKEKNLAEKLIRIAGSKNIIDAVGKTSLGQLMGIIEKLNLFIGNDGGPLHIAAGLGVKTVSIFGPVDEKIYGPIGNPARHSVICKDLSCRPCYKDFKISGCEKMDCLIQINEDEVLKAVESLL